MSARLLVVVDLPVVRVVVDKPDFESLAILDALVGLAVAVTVAR